MTDEAGIAQTVEHTPRNREVPGSTPGAGSILELTLPWPPSVNTYWRSLVIKGQLRVLISERGKSYRREVGITCYDPAVKAWGRINHGKPIAVHIGCYPPDSRRRDLDNLPKGVLDALVDAQVLRDDSDIWDLRMTRLCVSAPPGRIVVRLQSFNLALLGAPAA